MKVSQTGERSCPALAMMLIVYSGHWSSPVSVILPAQPNRYLLHKILLLRALVQYGLGGAL